MAPRTFWLKVRHRVELWAFKAAAALFGALPVETASNVSGVLWRRLAPLSGRHARALKHVALAYPDITGTDRRRIVDGMFENLGRIFGEAFHLHEIAETGRVTYENKHLLDQWAATPGGRVACAGHLGNWELAILGIMQVGAKPWSIYRPLANPDVDAVVLDMREFLYTGGLVPKNPALPRQFLKLVKGGATIGFLADQRDNSGVKVPLFGMPAASTIFPALLARSIDKNILMVRMRRLPGVRFVQSFEMVEMPLTDDRKADVEVATARIQSAFERYIRDAPEQWMWAHRRWG